MSFQTGQTTYRCQLMAFGMHDQAALRAGDHFACRGVVNAQAARVLERRQRHARQDFDIGRGWETVAVAARRTGAQRRRVRSGGWRSLELRVVVVAVAAGRDGRSVVVARDRAHRCRRHGRCTGVARRGRRVSQGHGPCHGRRRWGRDRVVRPTSRDLHVDAAQAAAELVRVVRRRRVVRRVLERLGFKGLHRQGEGQRE